MVIQQECIKFIKSDSKVIYDFYIKYIFLFVTLLIKKIKVKNESVSSKIFKYIYFFISEHNIKTIKNEKQIKIDFLKKMFYFNIS